VSKSAAIEVGNWLRGHAAPGANLTADSRTVAKGDVFLAWPGERHDGRAFIDASIRHGAAAIVLDDAGGFIWQAGWRVPYHAVSGLKMQAGTIAADWYRYPALEMYGVGVTGTSGKSSCTNWIAESMGAMHRPCARVGTLGAGFDGPFDDTGLTTPDPVRLQRLLRTWRDQGAEAFAMEVSSIGLSEGRVAGVNFDVAVFTNLSRDHLDYHGTTAQYELAKASLFAWPGLRHAVINRDDEAGMRMAALAAQHGAAVLTYSALGAGDADLRATDIHIDVDGMNFEIEGNFGRYRLATRLVGEFNVANLLAVAGVLQLSGFAIEDALTALSQVSPVPGRLERVAIDGRPCVVIDYAHKPDALEKALCACRTLAQARGGRLEVVFGCGGDRDAGKRAVMGAIAARLADGVVVTSDNPRSEPPLSIIEQILEGVPRGAPHVRAVVDRREAIRLAIDGAACADVVLIAGKGHETYQEIDATRLPFSDRDEALAALVTTPGAATC